MNKKLTAGFLVFTGAAAAIGMAAAGYAKGGAYSSGFSIGWGEAGLSRTEEFAAEEIRNIRISYQSQRIYLYQGDADKIIIKEYIDDARTGEETKIGIQGDTLFILRENSEKIMSGIHFQSEKIEIFLPESYDGSLQLTVSSGNIEMAGAFRLQAFMAETKSGNISCGDIAAEEIIASAKSGNIVFERAQGNRVMTTQSGNITIKNGEGDTLLSVKSGNISVEGAAGGFDAAATSGSVKASFEKAEKDISVAVNSGGIQLELPADAVFHYQGSSSSGRIRTDFDESLRFNERKNKAEGSYGNGSGTAVRTKATSGNTHITLK